MDNQRPPVIGDLIRLSNGNEYRVLGVQALARSGTYLVNGYEISAGDHGPCLKPYELTWSISSPTSPPESAYRIASEYT
jgi:hypothetical protein